MKTDNRLSMLVKNEVGMLHQVATYQLLTQVIVVDLHKVTEIYVQE